MTETPEFALADKAITFAAAKIEQAMVELLQTTLPLSHVVPTDYVVKRLWATSPNKFYDLTWSSTDVLERGPRAG